MELTQTTKPFEQWLDLRAQEGWIWYVKQLSGNDTLATDAHQAGPYVPKAVFFEVFPSLNSQTKTNPDKRFELCLDSHGEVREVRAVWYNNKVTQGKTRNECRFTNFGGRNSPLLDPDSTGDVVIFAFHKASSGDAEEARAWLCKADEREVFEGKFGEISAGDTLFLTHGAGGLLTTKSSGSTAHKNCRLTPAQIPAAWIKEFPSATAIIQKTFDLSCKLRGSPDKLVLARRECEFEVFQSIEEILTLPRIKAGFHSVNEFIDFANSIANRRKSRGGRSLELHLKKLFDEGSLAYSHGEISEGNKKPDFLFPSAKKYRSSSFPAEKLRMLASKTTCKDRWRQILNEADRIPKKHLFTLQQGVSVNQFNEMESAGVVLVVPKALHDSFPKTVKPKLVTLEKFIAETSVL